MKGARVLVVFALASTACYGKIGELESSCELPAVPAARRLSHAEYRHTVRDLFPGLAVPAFDLAPDPTPRGFDNDEQALQPSSLLVYQYNVAAARIAEAVVRHKQRFVMCSERSCASEYIAALATRAFRRPVDADELATFQQVFDAQLASNGFDIAIELTTQAILQSPAFLYRIESPGPDGKPSPYDVASRLSYFLWGSMPDDELLVTASAGGLRTNESVADEVDRMLADPRALDGFMGFASQWLDLGRLERTVKNPEDGLDDTTRAALAKEARMFLGEIIFARGGTLTDLLTSSRGFIGPETAAFYGLTASDWQEVDLPAERRGFLTQAHFLASHGHPNNPSPVLRGNFILTQLLCIQVGSPPADVDTSVPGPQPDSGPTTNRQNYERVTGADRCQRCHSKINPVGFTLENFDTMGRHRTLDNGLPVDANVEFLGTPIAGAHGLVDFLAASPDVRTCATRKLLTYAGAGGPLSADDCLMRDVQTRFERSGGNLRELMKTIATHPRFTGLVEAH